MNVLIFVMTMLMLLSMLTYARLETYRSSQVFQLFFNKYMETDERSYINLAMEKQYQKTTASSQDGKPDQQPKVNANRRISLILLTDEKQRTTKAKEWEQTRLLLKNLIGALYGDQPFYKEAIQKHPQIVDELINDLVQTISKLPKNKKIKKASDLANLTLSDKLFDDFLYKMLHGAPYKEILAEKQPEYFLKPSEEGSAELDDGDKDDASEADEYKSPKGYYSLLDFVNMSPTTKIRVYLAPREVLMAVFNDKSIVDDIIEQRKAFYKQAAGDSDLNQLKEAFKNQFEQRRAPEIDPSTIDFSITKTNPKNYE